MKLKREQEKKN